MDFQVLRAADRNAPKTPPSRHYVLSTSFAVTRASFAIRREAIQIRFGHAD
jgi:hypothetical protein